jgi:hypothetical protein
MILPMSSKKLPQLGLPYIHHKIRGHFPLIQHKKSGHISKKRLKKRIYSHYFIELNFFPIIVNQRDATVRSQFYFILLQDHSTCSGCCPHPSSRVHNTVTTASGTGHILLQLPSSNVATLEEGSCNNIWPVMEAVVTVLCTRDDRYGQHPKLVEWSCSKIK